MVNNKRNTHGPRRFVVVVVVVVVEWLFYSKRIIIVRWAGLSDFLFR